MPDPLVQSLPSTQKALQNKYNDPNIFGGMDPSSPIATAMVQLDARRAANGQQPLSKLQTQLGLLAAQTGQAQTQVPSDHGFFGNVVNDIQTITRSIPRLPFGLYNEIKALPQAPDAVSAALSDNTGPLDMIRQLAQAPGLRDIPGAFIAGNLGTPGNLLKHPVMTALDALPFAEKVPFISNAIDTGKAAIATRAADSPLWADVKASRPGMFVQQTFGGDARDLAQLTAKNNEAVANQMHGVTPVAEGDVLTQANREINTLRSRYPEISDARLTELNDLVSRSADDITSLPPKEMAYTAEYRDLSDKLGDYNVSQELLGKIDGEFYTNSDAAKIIKARNSKRLAEEMGGIHNAINPTTPSLSPNEIFDNIDATLARSDIAIGGRNGKVFRTEGYAHALQAAGYDATELLQGVRAVNGLKGAERAGAQAALENLVNEFKIKPLVPISEISIPEILTTLSKFRSDPEAVLTADALKRGDWTEATKHAKNIARRTKFAIPDIEDALAQATTAAQGQRYLNKIGKFDPKGVERISKAADRAELSRPPARFLPKLQEDAAAKIGDKAMENAVKITADPDFDSILSHLRDHNYGWLKQEGLINDTEYNTIIREVKATWAEQKAAGYDPIFIHSVAPGTEFSIRSPKVLERIPTPSQVKRKMMDFTPAIKDMTAALQHQGMELLLRRGDEAFVDEVATAFGRGKQELMEQYHDRAMRAAEKRPHLDVQGHTEVLMKKEYERFDPEGMFGVSSPKLKAMAGNDEIYIPKALANNLRLTHTPYTSRLTTAIDPVMNVYRTALLPLSPRWHVNNIFSGGMLVTATAGFDAWKHVSEAWQMARSGDLPEGMPRGFGTVPRDIIDWSKKAGPEEKITALADLAGGKTMRRILDTISASKGKLKTVTDKSFEINGMFDDMYRSMAYLTGKDKALVKGLTGEEAHNIGIELSRKTMMSWDRMTPIERTVMRYAFPFYGWMSHITKVAMTYPFDHPFRTAVLGSFARNELADMGTSLPQKFLNGFFFGSGPNKKFMNMAGINPFSDVGNYFTLAGLLGQSNPLFGSTLEMLGVDPQSGGPELYPTLRYDAETGRLAAAHQNPFEIFATNIIPQSQILLGLAGAGGNFRDLLKSNPEAAGRQLVSAAGIPLVFKSVNVPQENIKAESARIDSQTKVLADALKSGDWSAAARYPGIAAVLPRLKELDKAGQLDQFKPSAQAQPGGAQTGGQSAIESAEKALLGTFTP